MYTPSRLLKSIQYWKMFVYERCHILNYEMKKTFRIWISLLVRKSFAVLFIFFHLNWQNFQKYYFTLIFYCYLVPQSQDRFLACCFTNDSFTCLSSFITITFLCIFVYYFHSDWFHNNVNILFYVLTYLIQNEMKWNEMIWTMVFFNSFALW